MAMKLIILLFLLLSGSVYAQTNNVNVIVIVLTDTNQVSMVINAISNRFPSALFYKANPKIVELETQIKLMEKRFKEEYEGIPEVFIGNGSETSKTQLDKYIKIIEQKEKDALNIRAKKDELNKLINKTL